MSGYYHYHYIAVVWNKEDYSDIHIIKNKISFGLFQYPIFFDTKDEAIIYSKKKGFKNCDTIKIFHTKM